MEKNVKKNMYKPFFIYIYIYIYIYKVYKQNHFAVQQKLRQHGKLTTIIFQNE